MSKKVELIPPDKKQCQAEKPNPKHSFMTMGGYHPKYIRCENVPSVIVYELAATQDGQKGSMSMCSDCLKVFIEQVGMDGFKVESIKKPKLRKKV